MSAPIRSAARPPIWAADIARREAQMNRGRQHIVSGHLPPNQAYRAWEVGNILRGGPSLAPLRKC
jgi:hypothetical protein